MNAAPEIMAAIITGSAGILATILGSFVALLIGRKLANRHKLEADLEAAKSDIWFLLAVEEAHCAHRKETSGESNKIRTRKLVQEDKGLSFSGKFTRGNC